MKPRKTSGGGKDSAKKKGGPHLENLNDSEEEAGKNTPSLKTGKGR